MAPPNVHPREVEPGLFQIDHHFLGDEGVIVSYLLRSGDELTLIEAGPGSTVETLLAGVRAAGFDPEQITRILLTHIHLDHAGAAGSLARRLPRARIFVHPLGAKHLVDPEKLLASATRIYGDRMEELWGEFLPVPEERLTVLEDGEVVDAGEWKLHALDTPGHANHHLSYHDPERGMVFTGDVAGVRMEGTPHVRPPTPPPELDLEAWVRSVRRLRGLGARRLYLTHAGGFDDPDRHLDELLARLFFWAGWAGARLDAGVARETITAELRAQGDAELAALVADPSALPDLLRRFELATNYPMSVDGLARYFRKWKERGGPATSAGGATPG